MSTRCKALVAGLFIGMAAGSESYADPIHLTCKSRVVPDPSLSLLVDLDYAANTAEIAALSDLKPLPDRYGKTGSPIHVTSAQVLWRRDIDAGQVQKLFYKLNRVNGGLSVAPAEADGDVIMDAPRDHIIVPGPMPKPRQGRGRFLNGDRNGRAASTTAALLAREVSAADGGRLRRFRWALA